MHWCLLEEGCAQVHCLSLHSEADIVRKHHHNHHRHHTDPPLAWPLCPYDFPLMHLAEEERHFLLLLKQLYQDPHSLCMTAKDLPFVIDLREDKLQRENIKEKK